MNSAPTRPPADIDREFTALRVMGLLGLLMVVYCPEIIAGSHALFFRDAGQFGYPVGIYVRDSFWRGEIPLWNPYSDCGVPFLAQWLTLALYPPSLIYVLLPSPWGMNIFILAHVFLAGLGMHRLAERWFGSRLGASVAALAFAWSGLMLHCWMWPSLIATLAWMPWVVWLCDRACSEGRRTWFLAALAGGMQMLTGSPEEILYTWLIVLAVWLAGRWPGRGERWRALARLAGVAALVAALAAAQLLPWMDLMAHGDRNTSAGGNDWSMPVWGAANFLVPLFHMEQSISGVCLQPDQAWVSSYYVGVIPLLAALAGVFLVRERRTNLLAALAVASVLCAMGDRGILLKVLRTLMPFLGITRYPVKYVVVTDFCLPLLAAAGLAKLWQAGERGRRCFVLTGLSLAVGVAAFAFCVPLPKDAPELVSQGFVALNGLERLLFLGAGLGAVLYALRCEDRRHRLLVGFALLFLMGLDVCTHVPRQNPTVRASDYDPAPPPMTQTPRLGESRAMLAREPKTLLLGLYGRDLEQWFQAQRDLLYGDLNLLAEVPSVNGFFPLHLREESLVAARLYKGPELPGLQEFLGVSQLCTNLFAWTPQTNFMPWATIGAAPVFRDDTNTLEAMAEPGFAPRKVVYLPLAASNQVTAVADARAEVVSNWFSAQKCVFEVRAAHRALLVIAQSYSHWWEATVDGVSAPVWRANEAFQAVEVPPGQHEVRLVYRDRSFQLGAAISLAGLLICAAGLFLPTPLLRR